MTRILPRILIGIVALAACSSLAYELVKRGIYGWTVFLVLPFCTGALVSWCLRPNSGWKASAIGVYTGLLGAFCFWY